MPDKKRTHITKDLESSLGADNSRRLYSITSVHDGKTQVVVEQTICERFPVTRLEDAEELYERLGRWHYSLSSLLKNHPRLTGKEE